MTAIWCILQLSAWGLLGYGLVALAWGARRVSLPLLAGLSGSVGMGAGALLQSYLSLAGLAPSRWTLLLVAAVGTGCVVAAWRWRGVPAPVKPSGLPRGWRAAALIAGGGLVALALVVIAGHGLGHVNYTWDAYMIWGLKGKYLSAAPVVGNPYFANPLLVPLHPNYPLGTPFLMAAMWAVSGSWSDWVAMLPFPVLMTALALLVYGWLAPRLGRLRAVWLTVLLMGAPRMLQFGGTGLADPSLGVWTLGAVICLIDWAEEGRRGSLLLAAGLAAAVAFTKNEGLPMVLWLAVAAVVGGWRYGRLREAWMAAGLALLLLLPWLLLRSMLPAVDENLAGRSLGVLGELGRLPGVVKTLGGYLFLQGHWNGLWWLLLAALLVGRRWWRVGPLQMVLVVVAGQLVTYGLIYTVHPDLGGGIIESTFPRLALHVLPLAALAVGLAWETLEGQRLRFGSGLHNRCDGIDSGTVRKHLQTGGHEQP